MDFKGFKPRTKTCDYLYRCKRCKRETVFTIKLPEHMLTDTEPQALGNGQVKRRCGGKYEFIKEVPLT